MAHDPAGMAFMEDPTKGFGEIIGWVEYSRDKTHDNVASFFPILDGKVLDINVTGALSGDTGVDHIDGRLIVLIDGSGASQRETEVLHDSAEVLGLLGSIDGSEEFGLGGTCCSDALGLAAIRNSTTRK